MPRLPGDGEYAPDNDGGVEVRPTTVPIFPVPSKLKPFHLDTVFVVPDNCNSNGNSVSPSIVKPNVTVDLPPENTTTHTNNHSPTGDDSANQRDGESTQLFIDY